MSSLLLRFAGPAQSWGSAQLFPGTVQTERVPTRSGVLGLLACCLGAPRGAWPAWVEDVRVWARVDRPGDIRADYQTVNGVPPELEVHFLRSAVAEHPKRKPPKVETSEGGAYNISRRRFLADAEFLLAVEHDERVDDLWEAVRAPGFMPYLGRKPFAPTFPFVLGRSDLAGPDALAVVPTVGAGGSARLEVYPVVSDRNVRHDSVTVPVTSRKEQLAWASAHLSR